MAGFISPDRGSHSDDDQLLLELDDICEQKDVLVESNKQSDAAADLEQGVLDSQPRQLVRCNQRWVTVFLGLACLVYVVHSGFELKERLHHPPTTQEEITVAASDISLRFIFREDNGDPPSKSDFEVSYQSANTPLATNTSGATTTVTTGRANMVTKLESWQAFYDGVLFEGNIPGINVVCDSCMHVLNHGQISKIYIRDFGMQLNDGSAVGVKNTADGANFLIEYGTVEHRKDDPNTLPFTFVGLPSTTLVTVVRVYPFRTYTVLDILTTCAIVLLYADHIFALRKRLCVTGARPASNSKANLSSVETRA